MRNDNLSIPIIREIDLFYEAHAALHVMFECVCDHEYCGQRAEGSAGQSGCEWLEGACAVYVDASMKTVGAD